MKNYYRSTKYVVGTTRQNFATPPNYPPPDLNLFISNIIIVRLFIIKKYVFSFFLLFFFFILINHFIFFMNESGVQKADCLYLYCLRVHRSFICETNKQSKESQESRKQNLNLNLNRIIKIWVMLLKFKVLSRQQL